MKADLYTDGASRGNPGPSAAAWILFVDGREVLSGSELLGIGTNNRAEYEALRRGLLSARKAGVSSICIHLDSELVVRQITGRYRVHSAQLRPLYNEVLDLLGQFSWWSVEHTGRETPQIQRADALCNQALDSMSRR